MQNKNNAATKPDKSLVVQKTSDEVRIWLRSTTGSLDPDQVLQKAGEIITKGLSASDKASKEELSTISDALMLTSHERHYLVAESVVDERWRSMVMDLAAQIQKEYACTTTSEIALAGLAAGSYYRSLRASRKMNALLEKTEIGTVGVQLMSHVSKEIDRAHRHYFSIIETLRNRRQPQINVNVKAKAAFFGENQTFNAKPQQDYEINDPQ